MNNNKCSFISFKCYKSYYYILAYWILEIITSIIQNFFSDYFILDKGNAENEFINLACIVIADLLAGVLVLYTKCSMKSVNKTLKRKKSKNEPNLIYNDEIKQKKQKRISLLLLISILHLISISSFFLFYLFMKLKENENIVILKNYQIDWLIGIDIIFRHIFSRLILKTELYKHHIWSLIICLFGILLMTISDGISILLGKKEIKIFYYIFIIARPLLFSLADVLDKILLSDDFLLPHYLMFNRGIINIIILSISAACLIVTSKLEFIIISEDLFKRILIKCGFIFVAFLKAFFLLKIIYIFTSQYVSFLVMAEAFGGILNHFHDIFISGKNFNEKIGNSYSIIIDIISIIIITFGALLYNEMIIINKWHLEVNTKKELLIKERNEEDEMINVKELDEEDNNSDIKDLSEDNDTNDE